MKVLLTDGTLAEKQQDNSIAFFRLAFRPFFLLAALFSIVSILLWSAAFTGQVNFPVYGGIMWWHVHEMLFGFAATVVVGFLLTAVQTWTGVPSIKGRPLMALVALWLSARITFLFPGLIPAWLAAVLDLAFLPVAAACLAYPIIRVKMWRNMPFIPILLAMAGVNVAMHYFAGSGGGAGMLQTANVMVMLVTLVMCIMGGRVFPMFTANGTGTERVATLPWLEKLSITTVVVAVVVSLHWVDLPGLLVAGIYFLAAASNTVRAARWRIWVTWKTPLVWSLHLAYWSIPLGLFLLGLAQISSLVTQSQAIHALTVGGMGTMILAMISRVSLGHTGRQIVVGRAMVLAFVIIYSAFLLRVFGSYIFDSYATVIAMTAMLWAIAYGCFVVMYMPILTKPRVDGQPG